jgi:hypothetical protein
VHQQAALYSAVVAAAAAWHLQLLRQALLVLMVLAVLALACWA